MLRITAAFNLSKNSASAGLIEADDAETNGEVAYIFFISSRCRNRFCTVCERKSMEKGFTIYASAPLSIPSILPRSEVTAVNMITGICERSTLYLMRRHSSIPSMGSIITSVTTRLTLLRSICSKALSPSVAVIILYSLSKHLFSYCSICTLSSTSSSVYGLACVSCIVSGSAFTVVTSPFPLASSLTGTSCTKGKVSTNTFVSVSFPIRR